MRLFKPVPPEGLRSLRQPQRTAINRALDETLFRDLFHGISHWKSHDRRAMDSGLIDDLFDHVLRQKRSDRVMNQDNFGVSTDFRQRMPYGILPLFTPGHYFRHLGKPVRDHD